MKVELLQGPHRIIRDKELAFGNTEVAWTGKNMGENRSSAKLTE